MRQVTLEVYGMKCEGCVRTVKMTLEKYQGVKSAEVNLLPPEALITFEGDYSPSELIKHLQENSQYKALVKG